MKIKSDEIANILISAFDMDIQKYLKKIIEELRRTKNGDKIAQWAIANPIKFNAILHLVSIAIQRIPDKTLLLKVVKSQLVRLPSEIIEIAHYQNESIEENDLPDNDTDKLIAGLSLLKGWEMTKKEENKPAISLYDYLENSAIMIKELGQAFKEHINEETSELLKEKMKAELDTPIQKWEMFEKLKESNPALGPDEILQLMGSSEFIEAQNLVIEAAIRLPDAWIKAASELERINLVIKSKIKGKDINQSIEIMKSVYRDETSNYISELMQNQSIDDDVKQRKVDRQLEAYGKIVEMCENFKN